MRHPDPALAFATLLAGLSAGVALVLCGWLARLAMEAAL